MPEEAWPRRGLQSNVLPLAKLCAPAQVFVGLKDGAAFPHVPFDLAGASLFSFPPWSASRSLPSLSAFSPQLLNVSISLHFHCPV